ncbi:hypothetical protein EVAR_87033_1 [Eumeta japonica]|uniref:Uncharacterized protein n=1 Tax=Eumeta variegata TaxID=151549 RepID=A0A4C1YZY9_EUMVA|nr:hypothetical protein EVAR_87033_1 [Eumeta japonica]
MGSNSFRRCFGPVSESSRGQLLPMQFLPTRSSPIRYPFLVQETGNALLTPLVLLVSLGGGDRLLSPVSPAHSSLNFAINKPIQTSRFRYASRRVGSQIRGSVRNGSDPIRIARSSAGRGRDHQSSRFNGISTYQFCLPELLAVSECTTLSTLYKTFASLPIESVAFVRKGIETDHDHDRNGKSSVIALVKISDDGQTRTCSMRHAADPRHRFYATNVYPTDWILIRKD